MTKLVHDHEASFGCCADHFNRAHKVSAEDFKLTKMSMDILQIVRNHGFKTSMDIESLTRQNIRDYLAREMNSSDGTIDSDY